MSCCLTQGRRLIAVGFLGSGLALIGCGSDSGSSTPLPVTSSYTRVNLVADKASFSDAAGRAAFTDAKLINPWGIALNPSGPFWIADNGSGVSTLYDETGKSAPAGAPLVVTIPAAPGAGAGVTGIVYNGTSDFAVTSGNPAKFLFVTEDATLAAWSSGSSAVIEVNNASLNRRVVYKGVAIGSNASGNFLYAANFGGGLVEVYDKSFKAVTLSGSFIDPNTPSGFAPFGIQNINGKLYVSYARQDANLHDDVAGAGSGFISLFDTSGNFIRRLVTGSAAGGSVAVLNSPWGMALAPANFGSFSNALLVGNFGDGRINAFDPNTGVLLGTLKDTTGTPIAISGLWGLTFGNGTGAGSATTLYFTAGVNGEQGGLFGKITLN